MAPNVRSPRRGSSEHAHRAGALNAVDEPWFVCLVRRFVDECQFDSLRSLSIWASQRLIGRLHHGSIADLAWATTLPMRTHRCTRPATPQHHVSEDRYLPASSAGQVFSAPCSGVLALLFHMFSKPWLSATNHKRVLHCPKRNRLRWPKSRWLRPRSGLAAWQQVRLLTGCFDLESRGDAALSLLPAVRLAGKEREHLWSCSR